METFPLKKTLHVMRSAFPEARRFSILTSDTPTSDVMIELIRSKEAETSLKKAKMGLRKTYKLRAWDDWKNAIEEINREDDFVWFIIPFGVLDGYNQHVTPARMVKWVNEHLKKPSIGPRSLSKAMLLAVGIDAENLGRETGEEIKKFYRGTPIKGIPHKVSESYELIVSSTNPMRKRFALKVGKEGRILKGE